MALMCNLTHDVCCQLSVLENTGALQYIFSEVNPDTRPGGPGCHFKESRTLSNFQ